MRTFSAKYQAENTTFNKADLEQLERMLTEETEGGLKISEINIYFEEFSVEMHSFINPNEIELEDFEENPKRIHIVAHGYDENRKISKSAYVNLWRGSAEFNLRGSDHKWVLGLKEQLRRFIKTKTKWDYVGLLQVLIALVSAPVASVSTSAFINKRNSAALGFFFVWIVCIVLSIMLGLWNVYKRPSRIHLKQVRTSRISWQLVVAIATLLLTATGVLVAYMTFVQGKQILP